MPRLTSLTLSGATRATVNRLKSPDRLHLNLSGASQANLADYLASDANINLGRGSRASVNVVGKPSATLSGASRLDYSGNPALGTISKSGSSLVSRSQPQGDK